MEATNEQTPCPAGPLVLLCVLCSKTSLAEQERGGLSIWIGVLAGDFLRGMYIYTCDFEFWAPHKSETPLAASRTTKIAKECGRTSKTASQFQLGGFISQVIMPRFPLQGPPNYYLIKSRFQAVTHKGGSIITMELEKGFLPDVVLLWQGDKVLWKDPSLFWRVSFAKQLIFLALSSLGCQMGHFTGVLWIRSVCSAD